MPELPELAHALLELAQPLAFRVGDFLRLAQPLVGDLEALGPVVLELGQLQLALGVLALALEVRGEFLELLAAGPP